MSDELLNSLIGSLEWRRDAASSSAH